MARKKKQVKEEKVVEAEITPQPITETIETNYMPYVMTVIVSRALPEIDGFKPAHRKLLYTMYEMGLLTGPRTKSANIVGQTMHLNPHGDSAIYETMVRLTRGSECLLHPFIDSKGSFGKQYSRDMAYAASRYTEAKLDPFCNELFSGIDKDAVDFVPNYDNTTTEPTLLPTTFPNILVSPNLGIAVGMACSICSFNLAEVCDGTIALLKNPHASIERIMDIIKAPDFPGGGILLYNRADMEKIYETGVGGIPVRARYHYDPDENAIDIVEIPYSTSIEAIMKKITDMMKEGKLRDVVDIRDAIDLNGFKLTLDLRRGADPEKLMSLLYKTTPLQDSFGCNFNILVGGTPKTLGVREILLAWIDFRKQCYSRELRFDLGKKQDKLMLLLGLSKILLDIDKAIRIIRNTVKEEDVTKNLMEGFGLTERQAEYIADIKLRHLNREYILNRIKEIEDLQKAIADIEAILADDVKLKAEIAKQLTEIKKKYGKPRKTQILDASEVTDAEPVSEVENYKVRLIMTHDGYFKKITAQSLRGNDEQKLKEEDYVVYSEDTDNLGEMLFFTNKAQVYKMKVADFEPTKASMFGDYLPARIKMDAEERPVACKVVDGYRENRHFVLIFANGKAVRIPENAYETKSNRRRLSPGFSSVSPLVNMVYEEEPRDILIASNADRAILLRSDLIPEKVTRTSGGTTVFTLKKGQTVSLATTDFADRLEKPERYRKRAVPAAGTLLSDSDKETVFK